MSIQMNPSPPGCSPLVQNLKDSKVSSGPTKMTIHFPKISQSVTLVSEKGRKVMEDLASSSEGQEKAILGKRKFEEIKIEVDLSHKKRKTADSSYESEEDTLSDASSHEGTSKNKTKKTAHVIHQLNKGPWQVDELARLNEAMENVEDSIKDYWNTIAQSVLTRTSKQCRNKYYEMCKEKWNSEEIKALKKACKKYPEDWVKIAEVLGNRTRGQCKRKAESLNLLGTKEWTPEEKALLIKLAQAYVNANRKINWNKIVEKIPSKTTNQCRAGWLVLDPSLNKEPWTAEEDAKILSIIDQYRITYKGKPSISWKDLAKELPGRSSVACAKRYNRHLSDQ